MRGRPIDWVVFSDDWGRHASSAQHLFARIAKNHRVLWVNTIGLRAAKADAFTFRRGLEKLAEWTRPFRRISPTLSVLSPIMLPISGGGWLGRLNRALTAATVRHTLGRLGMRRPVLFASIPTAEDMVGRLGESTVVYYVTDDFSQWPGGNAEAIRAADHRLARVADVCLPVCEPLKDLHSGVAARQVMLPHGVDFHHFARPADAEPDDLADIPRPRVCFFGLIYEHIDTPAIERLADAMPEAQVVLVGPVQRDVSGLAARANVHLLGPRPYDRLPAYLQAMDVLIVPYADTDGAKALGPLKIRECLATGKPTVARAIPDLVPLGDVVSLYDRSEELTVPVRQALEGDGRTEAIRARRARVRSESWERRAEVLLGEVRRLVDRPSGGVTVGVERRWPDWSGYLARRADATIYHDPRWGEVMQAAYGNRPWYLTARRGGEVVGCLQLIEQRSVLFGAHLSSLPYFDSASMLADGADVRSAMLETVGRLTARRRCAFAELREEGEPGPDEQAVRTDKVTLRLELGGDAEALWNGLKAKVRNQVRKAQREGCAARAGGGELLRAFYGVYVRTMRDLGSPPHAERFFRVLIERFGESCRLYLVEREGTVLAGSLVVDDAVAARVPWAGADWRYRKLNANMLLYWTMLSDACRRGAATFDFGRSTVDAGTYKFKLQWGSRVVPLAWRYVLAAGEALPELRSDSAKYRLFVRAWTKLPVGAARAIGPWLISKLS